MDKKVAEGDQALDWAFELKPPSQWMSLENPPLMIDMGWEEFEEWQWPF